MTIAKTFQLWRRFLVRRIRRRPLLPFLLAATVAVTAMALSLDSQSTRWLWSLSTSVAGLGLLGIWLGQWRRGWFARLLLTCCSVAIVAWLLSEAFQSHLSELLTIFGLYAAGIATTRLLAVGIGWAIARWRDKPTHSVRFSMATLLAALTAAACSAALVRQIDIDIPRGAVVELILSFGSWALLPLVSYEAVRRVRRTWFAILDIAGIALVSAIACSWSTGIPAYSIVPPTLWQGVFIGAWLIGLHSRNRPIERTQNETPPALRIAETPGEESVAATQPGGIDFEA